MKSPLDGTSESSPSDVDTVNTDDGLDFLLRRSVAEAEKKKQRQLTINKEEDRNEENHDGD